MIFLKDSKDSWMVFYFIQKPVQGLKSFANCKREESKKLFWGLNKC